jgi:hypothetical protein
MPQIISRIDWHRGMKLEELEDQISHQIRQIWLGRLSEETTTPLATSEQGLAKLDEIILQQAETLGWRLPISCIVLERMSMWQLEPQGPKLFERLGKAMAKSARIAQKKELPPIDNPDLISIQTQAIRELRSLFRDMKKMFSRKRANLGEGEIAEAFVKIVYDSGDRYPFLKSNLIRWQMFFEQDPISLKVFAWSARPSPAALFHYWLSWCKGHEPETIRKKISEMRNSRKNR